MGLREEKKLKTRSMILEKSYELFESKGVENVGMRELALNCSLGIGTYYNYFKSKDEVVIDLISDLITKHLSERANSSLLDLIFYLTKKRNIFNSFVSIAMKPDNGAHLKDFKKLLAQVDQGQDVEAAFYKFITISHFNLINNEIDTSHFAKRINFA